MIKLNILSWGDYPGVSRRAQCHHKGLHKREAKGDLIAGDGIQSDTV